MTIITANLTRSRIAVIKDRVRTICTPGETVDVLVTEWGIAVNPRRTDLLERFTKAKLSVRSIEELREKAERLCGKARPIPEASASLGSSNTATARSLTLCVPKRKNLRPAAYT